jgi:hypothetical protein
MRLLHYTDKEFELEPRDYDEPMLYWRAKPIGLWVSVEGERDWKSWCESEEFRLDSLAISYEVILKEDANILYLTTPEEILNLHLEYSFLRTQWKDPEGTKLCKSYELDWKKMKKKYQGIIISPYQWDCRFHNDACWYYGWDCASGCIWDLSCIKEFRKVS